MHIVPVKRFFPSVVEKPQLLPLNLWSSSCKYVEVLHFCPFSTPSLFIFLFYFSSQWPSFQLTVTGQKWPWKHLLPSLNLPVKITVEVCRWFISLKNLWQYFCSPAGNCLQACICLFCFAQGIDKSAESQDCGSAVISSLQLPLCKCSFHFRQALMNMLPSF